MSGGSSDTKQVSEGGFQFLGDSAGGQGILNQQNDFISQMQGLMGQYSPEQFGGFMTNLSGDMGGIAKGGVDLFRDQFMEPYRAESMQAGRNISDNFGKVGGLFSGAFGKAYGQGVAEPFARGSSELAGRGMDLFGQGMGYGAQNFGQRGQQAAGLFGQSMQPTTDVSQAVYEQPMYATESNQWSLL